MSSRRPNCLRLSRLSPIAGHSPTRARAFELFHSLVRAPIRLDLHPYMHVDTTAGQAGDGVGQLVGLDAMVGIPDLLVAPVEIGGRRRSHRRRKALDSTVGLGVGRYRQHDSGGDQSGQDTTLHVVPPERTVLTTTSNSDSFASCSQPSDRRASGHGERVHDLRRVHRIGCRGQHSEGGDCDKAQGC